MNSVLSGLTVEQLALALTGEPRLAMNEVLDECRRRQRQLEAAEGMARAIDLLNYQAALTPPSETIQLDISRCRHTVAAYTAAKGER